MNDIKCPNCGQTIQINQALQHQIEEDLSLKIKNKYKLEFEKKEEDIKKQAENKIKEENSLKIKDLENEAYENKKKNEDFQKQILEQNKLMRDLKNKDDERELEMQKRMQAEREDISKRESEKSQLKLAELQKQLNDTKKSLEEAQRKSSQGSQQLQGEVLELQIEESLRNAFIDDTIEPIAKGVKGADIRHIVKTSRGNVCGIILWELKRTKQWSDDWITKLKQDLRVEKAHIPIIVSETLPEEAKNGFGHRDGVIICSFSLCLSVAEIMRQQLIAIARERFVLEHKNNKTEAEQLFDYITSHEFLQQIEALVETQKAMQEQINKEKAAFEKMWKIREIQVQKIFRTTASIAGNMQGIIGNSMPQIKGLDLLENENNQQNLLE